LFSLGSAGGAAVSGPAWALGGWLAVRRSAGLPALAAVVLATHRAWRVGQSRFMKD